MVRALYSGTRDHPLPDAFNYSHSASLFLGTQKATPKNAWRLPALH